MPDDKSKLREDIFIILKRCTFCFLGAVIVKVSSIFILSIKEDYMSGPETVKGFFSCSKIVFAKVIFFLSWFCVHTYLSSLCSFPFRSHHVLRNASADTVMQLVVRNCPTLGRVLPFNLLQSQLAE